MAAKKMAMMAPAAPAAVRIAWAGWAPARRAMRPAADATFRAPDRASSRVRTWAVCIGSPSLVGGAPYREVAGWWADPGCLGWVSVNLLPGLCAGGVAVLVAGLPSGGVQPSGLD